MGLLFQNPAAWVGLAILGAPLLIHLLTRRTPRRIVFPTVRFIRRAQSNLSSLFRIRHWLLLAVRLLLLLALLLAFLRPVWRGGSVAAADSGTGRRVVVIVVDASMSMGYSQAGGGPTARARKAAEQILDSLGADDLANFIQIGAAVRSSFDQPSNNHASLRQDIRRFKPTLERADPDAAIAEALRQLAPFSGVRKEVHFISDFQRNNWEHVALAGVPESVVTVFVSVAESDPLNVAITDVRTLPGNPVQGERVEIVCEVANFGPNHATVPLTLRLGDESPLERSLDLGPNAVVSTTFRLRAQETGDFEGTVKIPDDALGADNVRHFSLQVADRIEALVLTDESPDDELAAHRFLCRALDPFVGDRGGRVQATVRRPDDVTAFDLARAHLVFVCGSRAWAESKAGLIVDYLRQGGGLIYFLGSHADKTNLATLKKVSEGELELPFEPGAHLNPGARGRYAVFEELNLDDPLLRGFRNVRDLGDIRFDRLFTTNSGLDPAEALIRYDNGHIAMARRHWELGTILLCNFNPTPADGDLVKRTLFVPLVHEITEAMRPQAGLWRSVQVGAPCAATVSYDGSGPLPTLTGPSGEQLNAMIEPGDGELMIFLPRAAEQGFYRIEGEQRTLRSIPVNVDSRESNLASLPTDALGELVDGSRGLGLAVHAANVGAMGRLIEGLPLWPALLVVAVGFLLTEQILTQVWRR